MRNFALPSISIPHKLTLVRTTFLLALAVPAIAVASGEKLMTLESLGWREKSFHGNTKYSLIHNSDQMIIKGHTDGSASALYQKKKINLEITPFLNWRWKVSNVYVNPEEREKTGDDFPARLYVVHKSGPFPWNTLAINYVWSSQNDIGQSWSSAYSKNSKIIVLQSGENRVGTWVEESRNISQDFRTYFNVHVKQLRGYAIMVDGDNTQSKATAWFSDVSFVKDTKPLYAPVSSTSFGTP